MVREVSASPHYFAKFKTWLWAIESIDWIHEARSEGAGILINPAAFATPKDLWELNQQLGRTMRGQTYFFLQTTLDYKTTVETQHPHKTESGKRFWVKGQDG
jgi:hypothetical protein